MAKSTMKPKVRSLDEFDARYLVDYHRTLLDAVPPRLPTTEPDVLPSIELLVSVTREVRTALEPPATRTAQDQ